MKRIFGGGGGGVLWKPKNPHSLDYLKYLHSVLEKNKTVTGNNRSLVVEALRAIAEILIWGDQNDSTVFDFFLEKQMLSFFLCIMKQKCGGRVTVQLLQTLNIMFENIRHETSLYFLLSNNHVNSIISHPFDFANEEIMAYYISFLRTLSLKLNAFTIHFFFDDKSGEFPLYTEALRFYNHSESMVRIAVRTITLSVYRLRDPLVLKFNVEQGIAQSYFTNLVTHVKNQVIEMDTYLHSEHESEHSVGRLTEFIDEHLDHIHYINDILILNLEELNHILTDQLMRRLFVPIYLGSLAPELQPGTLHVSRVTALFLLCHVFLTITYTPLVEHLLTLLLFGDGKDLCMGEDGHSDWSDAWNAPALSPEPDTSSDEEPGVQTAGRSQRADLPVLNGVVPLQLKPSDTMTSLDEMCTVARRPLFASLLGTLECASAAADHEAVFAVILFLAVGRNKGVPSHLLEAAQLPAASADCSCSARSTCATPVASGTPCTGEPPTTVVCQSSGTPTLGRHRPLCHTGAAHARPPQCDRHVVDRLVRIVVAASLEDCVRVITVQLCCLLLRQMILTSDNDDHDSDTADGAQSSGGSTPSFVNKSPRRSSFWGRSGRLSRSLYQAKQNLAEHLTDVYRNGDGTDLVDAFEYQYEQLQRFEIRPERLACDAQLLLSPQSPFLARDNVSPNMRCPLDDGEQAQRNVHLFLLVRQFMLDLHGKTDDYLPMQGPKERVKINDCFDLSKCDILACTVIVKSRGRTRSQRYLVTDDMQLILVEPDARKLGYGVAQFVAWLQDVEIQGDKDDPRSLRVTIRGGATARASNGPPALVAKFVFDDHIRCMAARQRLVKGRQLARQYKMDVIGELLGVPKAERRQTHSSARGGNSHSGKLPGYARPQRKPPVGDNPLYYRSASSSSANRAHKPHRYVQPHRKPTADGERTEAAETSRSSASPNASAAGTDASVDSIQLDELEPSLPSADDATGREARFVPAAGSARSGPIRQL